MLPSLAAFLAAFFAAFATFLLRFLWWLLISLAVRLACHRRRVVVVGVGKRRLVHDSSQGGLCTAPSGVGHCALRRREGELEMAGSLERPCGSVVCGGRGGGRVRSANVNRPPARSPAASPSAPIRDSARGMTRAAPPHVWSTRRYTGSRSAPSSVGCTAG